MPSCIHNISPTKQGTLLCTNSPASEAAWYFVFILFFTDANRRQLTSSIANEVLAHKEHMHGRDLLR